MVKFQVELGQPGRRPALRVMGPDIAARVSLPRGGGIRGSWGRTARGKSKVQSPRSQVGSNGAGRASLPAIVILLHALTFFALKIGTYSENKGTSRYEKGTWSGDLSFSRHEKGASRHEKGTWSPELSFSRHEKGTSCHEKGTSRLETSFSCQNKGGSALE